MDWELVSAASPHLRCAPRAQGPGPGARGAGPGCSASDGYSHLSASVGAIRDALRAGTRAASMVTKTIAGTTMT